MNLDQTQLCEAPEAPLFASSAPTQILKNTKQSVRPRANQRPHLFSPNQASQKARESTIRNSIESPTKKKTQDWSFENLSEPRNRRPRFGQKA